MAHEMNLFGCPSQISRLGHNRGNWGQMRAVPQSIYKYFVFLYMDNWGSPRTRIWTGANA